ncbi:MAG: tetratricopeptide repeat protein [Bacteroidales bacterium]|jgi:tetratricopeptide (TPR) repeat protein|nr:tetratricopeptide repeat protein [Bacteroidales bacterium]
MKIKSTFRAAKLMIMSLMFCFCAFNANSQTAEEWLQRGETAYDNYDYQEAIECYEKVIKLKPDDAEAYFLMGVAYCYWNEQYEKAIECYKKVIELTPDNIFVYFNLGDTYLVWKQDYQKAIECYEKAIELEPDYGYTYRSIGTVYLKSGNISQAIEYYKKAAELGDEEAKQWLLDNGLSE